MKRFVKTLVSLLIAAVMLASLASCSLFKPGESGDAADFAAVKKMLDESSPVKFTTNVSYTVYGITLTGKYVLTVSDGGNSSQLDYEYEKLNLIGESDEYKSKISGTVYGNDKNEVGRMTDSQIVWEGGKSPVVMNFRDITEDVYEFTRVVENGGDLVLSGGLKSGIPESGASDGILTVTCDKQSGTVSKIRLTYDTADGGSVEAECAYGY